MLRTSGHKVYVMQNEKVLEIHCAILYLWSILLYYAFQKVKMVDLKLYS